jgi:hypothetical protein
MKKLRNINFYSVCSKISKRFLVFVRHKGQPVFGPFGTCLVPALIGYAAKPKRAHSERREESLAGEKGELPGDTTCHPL